MSRKQHVLALAERVGATVIYGRGSRTRDGRRGLYQITVDAPPDQHWCDGGVHQLIVAEWDEAPESAESLWTDALSRMRVGLEPCDCAALPDDAD